MPTECMPESLQFQAAQGRDVVARFDGGTLTSDGGAVLLREVERSTRIVAQFAACFTDHRDPARIEHPVASLVAQRVYGLALGYEDLNDHDALRADPLLAVLAGSADPTGAARSRARDSGKALAGKSTLNRLELTAATCAATERYKKITVDHDAVDRYFVALFLQAHATPPTEIVLDLDATDDPVHGAQEGRFFHGYYGHYCYLPLYIFAGEHLLCARLRPANIDASAGAVEEVARIVAQLRAAWPDVRIILRADSGFCRDALLTWCETHAVDYVIGLAKNARLTALIADDLTTVAQTCAETGAPARRFADLTYQTLDSWSTARRVVAKAEQLPGSDAPKANPRFVVTSIAADVLDAQPLYEVLYCARGEMENRIKEQQLMLFADRTSAATMRANQLRLTLSSVAYVLLAALRRLGLAGTTLATAQCQTMRLTLLKIGARIRVTARKVWIALTTGCPYAALFARVHANLRRC
jgi:Transposase DDE domain group 1